MINNPTVTGVDTSMGICTEWDVGAYRIVFQRLGTETPSADYADKEYVAEELVREAVVISDSIGNFAEILWAATRGELSQPNNALANSFAANFIRARNMGYAIEPITAEGKMATVRINFFQKRADLV